MIVAFIALQDMLIEWSIRGLEEAGHEVEKIWLDRCPDLIGLVEYSRPDAIVYAGPAGGPHCPDVETLRCLRNVAPSVFLCFDGSDVGWHKLLKDYEEASAFDLIVNCDGAETEAFHGITLWCPVNTSSFPKEPSRIKDRPIRFGFCGGHRQPNRYNIIGFLVHHGLTVKARDDRYGTYQDYTDFLSQCQIVINIPYSAGGHDGLQPMTKQFKARCIEVGFAGACLLEMRGSAAEKWLRPGYDYLAYSTREEAAEIVHTVSLDYVQEVADSLHKRCVTEYSPSVFWEKVFSRLK